MRRRFRAFPETPPHDSADFTNARAGVIVCGRHKLRRRSPPAERPPCGSSRKSGSVRPFDPVSIATFPVAEPEEMGYRVLDNFCEEHIQ